MLVLTHLKTLKMQFRRLEIEELWALYAQALAVLENEINERSGALFMQHTRF
jgi:hypothetical protein